MRTNSSRQYMWLVLFLVFTPFIGSMVALLIVDPLSLFHKPWVRDEYYIGDLRIQAAGIINNTPFDSMILGSSMAANFSIREASNVWDATFVNLSAQGFWFSGRSLILSYSLKQKTLENVIISLDGYANFGQDNPKFPITKYEYLYNDNPFDDIRIYTESRYRKYIYCRSSMVPVSLRCESVKDLEHIAEWPFMEEELQRFGGIGNWLGGGNVSQVRNALLKITQNIEKIKLGVFGEIDQEELRERKKDDRKYFDEYIFRYIQENPNTKFYLFFPPYSRLRAAILKQSRAVDFELYLEQVRYAVAKLEGTPNGLVFGFDDLDFLDDLGNYKDTGHYHPRYNSKILTWMYQRQHQLTKKNVASYLQTISQRANRYNLFPIGEKIKLQMIPSGSS